MRNSSKTPPVLPPVLGAYIKPRFHLRDGMVQRDGGLPASPCDGELAAAVKAMEAALAEHIEIGLRPALYDIERRVYWDRELNFIPTVVAFLAIAAVFVAAWVLPVVILGMHVR